MPTHRWSDDNGLDNPTTASVVAVKSPFLEFAGVSQVSLRRQEAIDEVADRAAVPSGRGVCGRRAGRPSGRGTAVRRPPGRPMDESNEASLGSSWPNAVSLGERAESLGGAFEAFPDCGGRLSWPLGRS